MIAHVRIMLIILIYPSGFVLAKLTENYDFLEGASGTFVGAAKVSREGEILFAVSLGGPCNDSHNCKASYAECANHTCTCMNGFVRLKNGTCQTTRLYCPNLKDGFPKPLNPRGLKTCYKLSNQNGTTGCSTSNSTNQEFCFLHPLTKTTHGAQLGHCCPKPIVGSKIDYGVCPVHPSLVPDMACEGCFEFAEQCITFKHWSSGNSYSFNSQCCPLPCRTTFTYDTISVNGLCYLNKYVGETCEFDSQCATANSRCAATSSSVHDKSKMMRQIPSAGSRVCQCENGFEAKINNELPDFHSIPKRTICVEVSS